MIYRRFIAPLPIETALLIYEWRNSPFRDRPSFHSKIGNFTDFRISCKISLANSKFRDAEAIFCSPRWVIIPRIRIYIWKYNFALETYALLLIFFSFLVTLLLRSVSIREKSFSTPKCNSLQTLEFLLFVYVSRAISTRSKYPKNNSIIITVCDKLLLRSVLFVQNEKTKFI